MIFFFSLKCFHPCLQDLNNSLTQFISGCCSLAVLQEATVAPVLVTNIGKCKVRKVFGSVTFSGCIFWNMCKDLALWGTSAWTSYGISICSISFFEGGVLTLLFSICCRIFSTLPTHVFDRQYSHIHGSRNCPLLF